MQKQLKLAGLVPALALGLLAMVAAPVIVVGLILRGLKDGHPSWVVLGGIVAALFTLALWAGRKRR